MTKKQSTTETTQLTTKKRYLLTEEEFWRVSDLCASLQLAVEKIILNAQLPRVYTWEHPSIQGFEKEVRMELERSNSLPHVNDFYDRS